MNEKLLRKLAEKNEIRYGDLKLPDKDQALAEMVAAGLVVETHVARGRVFALTPEGRTRAQELPPEPTRAPRPPRPRDDRLGEVLAALGRIEAALARLVPPSRAELKPRILEAVAALDGEHRYGGLVPIPELRRALRARGVVAGDADVNAALEELEGEFVVNLSIAQSPTTVPDRAAGIERPGRGLAYYVVRRQG